MNGTKVSISKILSIYLEGGVLKSREGEGFTERQEDLILSGYDRIGSVNEHSLLERYYSLDMKKGINFKLYFYKGDLWSSGIDFFGFRLRPILKLAKENISKIDVFFDADDFNDGALVINDFCVYRFSFMNEKSPRILTLETDISVCSSMQGSRVATESVCKQFVHVKDTHIFKGNRNVKRMFDMMRDIQALAASSDAGKHVVG